MFKFKKGYKFKKKNYKHKIIPFCMFITVLFLSVGYSAFQTDMEIGDINAIVHAEKDIRITNLTTFEFISSATSSYQDYTGDNISSRINLPNNNSKITYEIEVTNLGNVEMAISEITGLPNNLKYSILEDNYKVKDIICDDIEVNRCKLGAVKKIYLTIEYEENGYDSSNTEYQISLNFSFKQFYTISYDSFSSVENLPTSILEGETKQITFQNDIPADVLVTGATGLYSSSTLTLSNPTANVSLKKKHLITYVLDGGTQALNQATSIFSNETIELLDPTKEEYIFEGWYDNENFEGNKILQLSNITHNITLYANWNQFDVYVPDAEFDGTTQSIVNTELALYSAENVNKNFRISFTVDDYSDDYNTASNINNSKPPTILSSMVETSSPYSGFVFRVVKNKDVPVFSLKINDSHVTSFLGYYTLQKPLNVEIIRENGAMYTKINSRLYTKVLDYNGSIDTFDVPITIGGNINSSGNYDRMFDGSLSNVVVEFYEGSRIANMYNYVEHRTENSYTLDGVILFDGTNYIDTGLNLFSSQNINKDFTITFTVEEIGTNASQATLVNAKDESNSKYPGFAYRLDSSSRMQFTAKWPGESDSTKTDTVSTPKTVVIKRRNGVVYYSVNGSADTKLISTPASSLTSEFKSNLTFGASTKYDSSTGLYPPMRNFIGVVSDISVTLEN